MTSSILVPSTQSAGAMQWKNVKCDFWTLTVPGSLWFTHGAYGHQNWTTSNWWLDMQTTLQMWYSLINYNLLFGHQVSGFIFKCEHCITCSIQSQYLALLNMKYENISYDESVYVFIFKLPPDVGFPSSKKPRIISTCIIANSHIKLVLKYPFHQWQYFGWWLM